VAAELARDHLVEEAAHEVAGKYAEAISGLGGAIITAGKFTIDCAIKSVEEAEPLNDALRRENAVTACVCLCLPALPDDFPRSIFGQLESGKPAPKGEAMFTSIIAGPDGANVRAGIVGNCQDGQRYALAKGIATSVDLATALKQNPEFAQRYKHDLAFKIGTDSVVWASAHDAIAEVRSHLAPAPQAHTLEVRG
jgi:hypothetical protein